MKRQFGIALMLMVSMVVNAQVVVTIGEFTGGTIVEKSQEDQVVTITVTPATGYSIQKSDIVVVQTVNPNQSRNRGGEPILAEQLTLVGDDPENLSDPRDYIFIVPEGLGAWVKEATFHSLLSGALESGATWELANDAAKEKEKTLVINGEGAAGLGEGKAPWSAWSEVITKVVIDKSINELGDGLLSGLKALTNVEIQNNKQIVALGKDAIPDNKGLTVDVAGNLYNEYKTVEGWKAFTITSTTGVEMKGVAFGENNSYDTFVSDESLVVPSVLRVLAVTGVKDNTVIVEEIENVIPANLPVLLLSKTLKGNDFRTAKTSSGKKGASESLLYVAPKDGKKVDIGEVYLLYNDVFYFSQAGTIPEGGIYLKLPEEEEQGEQDPQKAPTAKARMFLTIGDSFGDGDGTTGIISHPSPLTSHLSSAWYDLNGCRLNGMPTAKGIYVHGGKKVVIK